MRKILMFALLAAIVVVMLAAGALVVFNPGSARGAERLDYGQTIRIDDFAFTALNSERGEQVGTLKPQGVYYIVDFQVTNNAKRVGFDFRPDTAILVDASGTEYHASTDARAEWFKTNGKRDACAHELVPGEVCETTLVFDVPTKTQAPLLKMAFGGGLFDVADALMYGNRVIQLK